MRPLNGSRPHAFTYLDKSLIEPHGPSLGSIAACIKHFSNGATQGLALP
jgi:hypothetical protein